MAEPQPNSDSGRTLPRSFGRFEVIDVLGRGGMATVYLAIDPVIGRKVALKVLRLDPALLDSERQELRARFVQEFRAAGTLTHPNLVTIYDVCTEEDTTFIAMEHLEGESLRDIVKAGRELTFEQLADLATQLCSGLDYAHAAGIVHRDIKPSNILLTKAGKPVITDFGVAKAASETSDLTEPGVVIGTPHYMAPEQVTGQTPSGSSDQFSLAVILYQLVTGQLPFTGTDAATILYRIVHHDPIPPSQLNLAFPAAAEDVLLRALSKDRSQRYATCAEFAQALCDGLDVEPPSLTSRQKVIAPPPPPRPPARRFAVHPVWPALLVVTALLAGLAWYQAHLPEVPIDLAFAPSVQRSEVIIHHVGMDGVEPGLALWLDGQDTGVVTPDPFTISGRRGQEVVIELHRGDTLVASQSITLGDQPAKVVAVTVPKEPPAPIRPKRRRVETPAPAPAPAPLPPATASFTVTSNPPGAQLMLNGQPLAGTTPLVVEFTEGRLYTMTLQHEGYATQAFSFLYPDDIEPQVRERRTLRFTMAPAKEALDVFGILRLPADVDYPVELRVAGKTYGPSERLEVPLPPGNYADISARAPDVFIERSWRKIEVRAGESVTLEMPAVVQVRVVTEPPGARISIEGTTLGYAPLSRPIAVGRYLITAEWPGPEPIRRTVSRKVGKSTGEIKIEQR